MPQEATHLEPVGMSPASVHQALSDLLRAVLPEHGSEVILGAGELLFAEGDPSDSIYLLNQGEMRVFIQNRSGDELDVACLMPGSVIGEMSLYGELRRSASCESLSAPCVLAQISNQDTLRLIDHDPSLRHRLMEELALRCRNMLDYVDEFSYLTQLVSSGDFDAVKTHLGSPGWEGDRTVQAARESFSNMLDRIRQREAELQTKIESLTIQIDHARAAREVSTIVDDHSFQDMVENSSALRERLHKSD
jgi:CRP-like cAMP-binding protein